MSKKLLVINSFGPMASTLLSGLAEKLGYSNTPLRKLGLNQYLMGEYALDCGHMEKRLKTALTKHSQKKLSGGISVLDRNSGTPVALTDISKVQDKLVDNFKAKSVQELYFKCRKIYLDAVIYKTVASNPDWQIEMSVDIHRYDHMALYDAYQTHFDDVKMIHLHRPFQGWINSLASQAMVHPEIKERIMFFPHLRHADYALYEEAVAAMPGMHIQFDDLFETPIEELYQTIADFTGVEAPKCDLRHEEFDMYGKSVPYKKAFTPFDDGQIFLQHKTRQKLDSMAQENNISNTPSAIIAWCLYIKDMIIYRFKGIKKA